MTDPTDRPGPANPDPPIDHLARMRRGERYLPGEPGVVAARARCHPLIARFNALELGMATNAERLAVLTELLGAIGLDTEIRPPFRCEYGDPIRIGARTFINFGAVILDGATVTIGDDVQIGPSVQLLTPTHPIDPVERREGWEIARPVSIGDGAWLGGGVIVLPGVSIGAEAVVGAGSVVTRNIPPRVVAAGNPCRILRPIDPPA
jgi:maltose O-acetyltransferase